MNKFLTLSQDLYREVVGSSELLSASNSWEQRLFGKEEIQINQSYSLSGHKRQRCGCFLCQSSNALKTGPNTPDIPDYFVDTDRAGVSLSDQHNGMKIGDTNAAFNLDGQSSLVLDSLAALNSPLISSLLLNAKWGAIDPDSGSTTELLFYISQPGDTVDAGGTTFAPVADPSTNERNIISAANDAFTDVANITLTETATLSEANLAWSVVTDSNASLGIADFPGNDGVNVVSHVVVDRNSYSDSAMQVGGYFGITYPHELGHALGLAHPHNGGAFGFNGYASDTIPGFIEGVSNSFTETADNDLNSTPFQLMTYVDSGSSAKVAGSDGSVDQFLSPRITSNDGYLENLGPIDIAAIQYLYGANGTTATGDNVYLLDNTTLNGYKTIWDNGGIDTISAINASAAVVVDLRNATLANEIGGGGFVSKIDDLYRGYTIAYNTTGTAVIENAIGSNAADRIIGNSASNTINGGVGADSMTGGSGDDTYVVDSAADVIVELDGEGTDLIQAASSTAGTTFTAPNFVENLTLTDSVANHGKGNALANIITGNSAANRLDGLDANDTINGQAGDDTISAGAGDDSIDGGAGADSMTGGAGDDTYVVDSAADVIVELDDEGTDLIQAASTTAGTTFTAASFVEKLTLTDTVANNANGNSLANTLSGNSANNSLNGLDGADTIIGGDGNDTLTGGAGNDQFNIGSGDDVITDFISGADKIGMNFGITYESKNEGSNLKITFSNASTVTLNDLQLGGFNSATDINVLGAPSPLSLIHI